MGGGIEGGGGREVHPAGSKGKCRSPRINQSINTSEGSAKYLLKVCLGAGRAKDIYRGHRLKLHVSGLAYGILLAHGTRIALPSLKCSV